MPFISWNCSVFFVEVPLFGFWSLLCLFCQFFFRLFVCSRYQCDYHFLNTFPWAEAVPSTWQARWQGGRTSWHPVFRALSSTTTQAGSLPLLPLQLPQHSTAQGGGGRGVSETREGVVRILHLPCSSASPPYAGINIFPGSACDCSRSKEHLLSPQPQHTNTYTSRVRTPTVTVAVSPAGRTEAPAVSPVELWWSSSAEPWVF